MVRMSGISRGRYALKDGKLVVVDVTFEEDFIKNIRITGDFFLHPEDRIEYIEDRLKGVAMDDVERVIRDAMRDTEYAGISPESLSIAIWEAWKRRS